MNDQPPLRDPLEYDPPNEDDAYDKARQEEVDAAMIIFPAEQTLVARGKYSTLASERREILREMRDSLETVASHTGRALRFPDDTGFIKLQLDSMRNVMDTLTTQYARLSVVQAALNELKPAAWGKDKAHE